MSHRVMVPAYRELVRSNPIYVKPESALENLELGDFVAGSSNTASVEVAPRALVGQGQSAGHIPRSYEIDAFDSEPPPYIQEPPFYTNTALLQGLLVFGAASLGIILVIIAAFTIFAFRVLRGLHRSVEKLQAEMQLQLEFFVRNQAHFPYQLRKSPSKALSTLKSQTDFDINGSKDGGLPLYEGRHAYAYGGEK
ncbi:hypothetical protein BJ138DRAFT_1222906 [Hygrophoropsis aurantiaca]|uniref:Uncharacterized protein n=1 Tax=Hygrophoropsis aurantiaca TaxID=72124 RepID=A0ACB7ZYG4_9AGAM|nr:hypothetical protein BJ138DRAFT_1222906 [Hygrophoropsis aurantiaca]